MKWNSSNQASFHFVWLEYNEGNQFLAQEKGSLVRNVTPHFPFKFFFKQNKYLYCSHFYESHWVQNFISKSPAIQTSFRQRRWRKEEVLQAWLCGGNVKYMKWKNSEFLPANLNFNLKCSLQTNFFYQVWPEDTTQQAGKTSSFHQRRWRNEVWMAGDFEMKFWTQWLL